MTIERLTDRLEITDALIRYTRAIDTGDWDGLDMVFTADAEIDYTQSGGIAASYAVITEPVKLIETSGGWINLTGLLGLDGGAGFVDPYLGWQGRG